MKKDIVITNFPKYISEHGGVKDQKDCLILPDDLGKGYIKILRLAPQLTIMLQHYELEKNIIIKRKNDRIEKDTLLFSFRNIIGKKSVSKQFHWKTLPSVQISSSDVVFDIKVPANTEISNIIIGIQVDYLQGLIQKDNNARITEFVTKKEQSFLFEEIISSKIQSVAHDIFLIDTAHNLQNFYYKIKAEELVCLFLETLLQRNEITGYPIHQNDVETLYQLREDILIDLTVVPQLDQLALKANMSVSKLGKIFKQIFGESIYNYYQKMKMQEASFLLREKKLSVSEVGYQLGFSNLSHFSRLFEKHIGMTPKKWQKEAN